MRSIWMLPLRSISRLLVWSSLPAPTGAGDVRQVEFRAYVSQSELKRLRQSKTSAGWVVGAAALALAWIFSAFGMSPSRLDFGTLQTGSGGLLPVQLTNRGMTEFHAASIVLDGADSA